MDRVRHHLRPGRALCYITNFNSDNVSVIDTATNTVVATVQVGNSPAGIAVTPDGDFVYVANQGSDNVSVIATATNTVVATVQVGNSPIALGQFIGPVSIGPPIDKEECKDNGWRAFNTPRRFKNQGDCIQFVNTGK
jgi:YVTN family beta-propeller protein